MKIVTIVGARPQFIKAAVVSRELKKSEDEVIVHTGQHYDYNMSDIFFEELNIPKPKYNLGVSGGTHGKMTGEMLIKIEEVLLTEKPDGVLLYGDTNSTLAGALAAVKLHIPIFHVEAGARLGTLNNPEEVNRIMTDHAATELLYCTESAIENLKKEGLIDKSIMVGDPMYDAFTYYSNKVGDEIPEKVKGIIEQNVELPSSFYYLTCHREENTKDDKNLSEILFAMEALDEKVVYPVHPRNKEQIIRLTRELKLKNILLIEPVGYLMSLYLIMHAKKIVTDSGGLQREAFFAEKQCVTIFDSIMWPETMVDNRNQLASPNKEEILKKLSSEQKIDKNYKPFGDGHSAIKISNVIKEYYRK